MHVTSRTNRGTEGRVNEDSLLVRRLDDGNLVLLMADGLGGHPGGEVASALVCDCIENLPTQRFSGDLSELLIEAGNAIIEHGSRHPAIDGMGSTATLTVLEADTIRWAHVGDTRLYHFSSGTLHSVTRDQTLARQAYDDGEIRFEEIRGHRFNHVLEQCMGEDDIEPDSGAFSWQPGDILLLSTDGLHDMMDHESIQDILNTGTGIENMADTLVENVLEAGGRDNISLILAHHTAAGR